MQNLKKTNSRKKGSEIILKVLVILKEKSSSKKPLSQADIMNILKNDINNLSCNPKTLSEVIHILINTLNPVEYNGKNGDEFIIKYNGWKKGKTEKITKIYYSPPINEKQVKILANGIQRLNDISEEEKNTIIGKLEKEYRIPNLKKADKVTYFYTDTSDNVNENTDIIADAIQSERQITFNFRGYDCNNKLEVLYKDGNPKIYTVNPYYIVDYKGKRYLLANTVPYDNISVYRVDLMFDIKKTKEVRRYINEIREFTNCTPMEYMKSHLNMMYGETRTITLKVEENSYTLIHDCFGDYTLCNNGCIEVKASEKSVIDLAMTAPDKIEVVRPETLREKILQKSLSLGEKYKK